jgi:hypothetical protein
MALVEEDAEAEEVRARVDLLPLDLLGCHVRGAAEHLPGRSHALRVEELRDPKVGQLHDDAIARLLGLRGLG